MGCCGSINKATDEQVKDMCKWSCRQMMTRLSNHAIELAGDQKNMQIPMPKEMGDLRSVSTNLRQAATESGSHVTSTTEGIAKQVEARLGSTIGGLVSRVGGLAADASGFAGQKIYGGLADQLDGILDKLDRTFSKLGAELCASKKSDMIEVFRDVIEKGTFRDALSLVRGPKFDFAGPSDAVTKEFFHTSRDLLVERLALIVQADVNKMNVVVLWDGLVDKVNASNQALTSVMGTQPKEPIKLDINLYIVNQVLDKLCEAMKVREGEIRKAPKSEELPPTFALCFSREPIDSKAYEQFCKDIAVDLNTTTTHI
mmetsp:Transcript_26040/g.57437  ORF Transcript_26040/g.57437 Transcript_26040/m.57437 type:complete len:314 (+) Transcript_26040:60-1001(+)